MKRMNLSKRYAGFVNRTKDNQSMCPYCGSVYTEEFEEHDYYVKHKCYTCNEEYIVWLVEKSGDEVLSVTAIDKTELSEEE